VAIKVLKPELAAAVGPERFLREIETTAGFTHPHILPLLDSGGADDLLYYVMPYVEGESLRDRLRREKQLPVEDAIRITRDVARALGYAHEHGILHRDIKPENILLEAGEAVVADFGIARAIEGGEGLTATGVAIGTPAYMSPEQASGEIELEPRSDLYSLGCVLYEMLAGKPPFTGPTAESILNQHRTAEIPSVIAVRPSCPEHVSGTLSRLLAKTPADRYATASVLGEALVTAEGSERARPPSDTAAGTQPLEQRTAIRRIALATLGAGVVAIGAWTAWSLWPRETPPPSLDDASLAIVDFRDLDTPDDPLASAEITALLHVGLVESSPIRVVSPDYLQDLRRRAFGSARGAIEEGQVLEVARQCGSTLFLAGRIKTGDYITWRLVDTRSGKSLAASKVDGGDLAVIADQIIAEVSPVLVRESGVEVSESPPSVNTLTTDSRKAHRHYIAGLLARQEWRIQDAVRELEYALELDSTFALAIFELSRAQFAGGERGKPVSDLAERAWQLRTRLGIKDRLRLDAWRQRIDRRILDALATYREMLARWPDDREVLSDLALMLRYHWYFEEAVEVAERGLKLFPDDLGFLSHYWGSLRLSGKPRKAIDTIRGYISRHPETLIGWSELGWGYLRVGFPDSAEAAFRKSLEIDPNYIDSQKGIGRCAYSKGDVRRAIETCRRILGRSDLSPGQRVNLLTGFSWGQGLPFYHAEAGRFNEALGCFEEARQHISDTEREARVEKSRAYLLLRAGKAEEVLRTARALAKHTDSRYASDVAIYLQAMALAAMDSLQAARTASVEWASREHSSGRHAVVMALKINAEIALAEKDPETALAFLRESSPGLFYSSGFLGIVGMQTREALARVHQMAGRLDEAANVHKELLRICGGHALSHYELGKIYQELGRPADAKQEFSRFLEMWADADEGLPQLENARARLAALGSSL
jgi:serine/threonine-protein kinase